MIETFLLVAAGYTAFGIAIGILFLMFGISRADHAAKGSGFGFRLIVFPGLVMLWPVVLGRWFSGRQINQDIHAEEKS